MSCLLAVNFTDMYCHFNCKVSTQKGPCEVGGEIHEFVGLRKLAVPGALLAGPSAMAFTPFVY